MTAPACDGAAAHPSQSGVHSSKSDLRKRLLATRRRLAPDAESGALRCAALLAVPEVAAARVVAGYTALRGEPDVEPVLAALRERGVRVLLPLLRTDNDLDFQELPDAPLTPLGAADVVIVPAVAADRRGRRLGRGGGSYDRALRRARADALLIAVVHPEELIDSVPVEQHDVRVGAVLAGGVVVRTLR